MDKAAELKAEYGKAKLEANNAQEDEDVRVVFFFSSLCVCNVYSEVIDCFIQVYIVNLILGSLAICFDFLLIYCGFFVIFLG